MGICVSCRRRDLQAQDKRAARAGGGRAPAKGAAAELLLRRADPAMANSISNIKMTNPIKGFVSKRRRRYMKDGFNLDLAYITDRLIAMGFPAEKLEGVYRNHIDEVYRFLEQMHKDHYKIYNLCSERCYDSSKFHGRVARYAFEDHTPPKMELIQPFCEDVHSWLAEDPRNVAAVHCKAGKGRTGTMLCCYLLYSGQKATADEALKYYGNKRTYDDKGVTIPSQRRYVEYYAEVVRRGLQYRATKLHIRELLMSPPPALSTPQCTLELTVSPHNKTAAVCHEVRKASLHTRLVLEQCTPLHGDVRVDVYSKPKMMRKEKLFHFWFNTFFVANCVGAVRVPPPADSMNLETYKLTLNKWQLDDAHKDKQHKLYSPDFKVELVVQQQPASSRALPAPARAPSPPSSASSASSSEPEPEDSEHWDSGEQPAEPTHAYLDFGRRCRCESETVNAYVPLDRQTDRQSRFDSTVIDPPLPLGTLDGTNKPGGLASRCRDLFRPISPERMDVPCDCLPDQKRKKNAKCNRLHMNCLDSKDGKDAKKLESRVGKDGYILIDRTPRPPVAPDCEMKPEPKSEISDPTGTRKGKHIGKDGYMLVDATPRRPPRPINSKLPATSTDDFYEPDPRHVDSRDETYMEFTTADGCIKPVEQTKTSFEDEYAFVDPEMSELTDDPNSMLADVSPKPDDIKSKPSKNKKHSFFKRDDYKNEKGKIPKVSSDHTISDSKNDKKAGRFFNRREDEGSKPKLSLFSVKWPENRKKKDRDDS